MADAGRQRHGVAAHVALHALGAAGGAAGVERVADRVGREPGAGDGDASQALAQRRVVHVAALDARHRGQAPVHQQHPRRLVPRQRDRLVEQRLVGHDLARAAAGVGTDHHHRLGIVDPAGEAVARETAEDHRVDRADARAREHRERGLGDHRHVDQHPVALAHAQLQQRRGHALHLVVQLGKGVDALGTGLGGDRDDRGLVRPRREVTVDRVVAEVGLAADEPAREGRAAVVADALEGPVPVDQRGLLAPEPVRVVDRTPIERCVAVVGCHGLSLLSNLGGISSARADAPLTGARRPGPAGQARFLKLQAAFKNPC
ncbi:hypothetical protein ISF6_4840 [Piscinibacter sakaiensis]|uniref:Uncharacterized protein n=1 Tax=Piscinibacter sakaiensis TaxID=1547922 RepID=A0A0K8P6Y6_PISS1|nr:hypothetical protein ISF6_4840 [Piscinibacter sakaiensis]